MTRCATLLFCWLLLTTIGSTAFAAPKKIPVETYRQQLQRLERQLAQIEQAPPPRRMAPLFEGASNDFVVQRADGQTQAASGDEFRRAAKAVTGSSSREQVRRWRESVAAKRVALEAWSTSDYEPADAQAIIGQLEGSGQIRTGPTWMEQKWSEMRQWITKTWLDWLKWVGSLFPSATPGELPTVDPNLIRAIFTLTVIVLLAAIAFLIWRALGGRMARNRKKQGAFAFSEDAELLLLPPDELRQRAGNFAAEGEYREALRYLYISLLLTLDARGVWRYDARRTNWEHIAALRKNANQSTLIEPLSDVTRRFDRVRYGNAPCDSNDWQKFERDVSALESTGGES